MNPTQALALQITKDFQVSKEELYEAWTDPDRLKEWWKPMGHLLTNVTNEIREGGQVSYAFNGGELKITGEYKEAKPGDKLVYTWNWEVAEESIHNGNFQLTIIFKDNGDESTLDVTQENFQNEESIQPHRHGWEEALGKLNEYLG